MAEHPAVNRRVAGSSPARGANFSNKIRHFMDRAIGAGLKYPTFFSDTHLQRV
jgi:hypothetical protein